MEKRRRASMSPPWRLRAARRQGIRDVPVPRCPDLRIAAAALPSHSRQGCSDVKLRLEPPLPAYSGVTVWASHPLRVVTGETSVVAGRV